MIKINLTPNEEKVLILAYFNMLSKKTADKQLRDITYLDNLTKLSLSDLDTLIESKALEKLENKYKDAINTFNINPSISYYKKMLGYPFSLNITGEPNMRLLRKLLLLKRSDLEPSITRDPDLLEIKFFYSMQCLKLIFDSNKISDKNQKLTFIYDWYIQWEDVLTTFFNYKGRASIFLFHVNKFLKHIQTCPNEKYYDLLAHKYLNKLSFFTDFFDTVFDYKSFISGDKEKRFLLSYLMKANVCLYCNRQYISILSGNKQTTATFDHYKREAAFPMLKISLFNLIPSCYACNTMLKGTSDKEHLYPWEDDENNLNFWYEEPSHSKLKAYYKWLNYDMIYNFNIKIASNNLSPRGKNSLDVFQLEDAYQIHNSYASNLVAKAFKYEQGGYKEDIYNFLKGHRILSDRKKVDELLYGMTFDSDINNKKDMNTPLYKLSSDLYHKVKKDLL